MTPARLPLPGPHPALHRLNALAPLDQAAVEKVSAALRHAITVPARRDLLSEGKGIEGPRIIVEGWAARVRFQIDGRRQFLSFLLPGDLIGSCHQPDPVSTTTVTALTRLRICSAPLADESATLATAYAMSGALEEAYLLDQIARLGRLNAQERILSLLLEVHERLELAGLATSNAFDMPLTQEQIADSLGLTSVHINRMIQQARRETGLVWSGKQVTIENRERLAKRIGRVPVRVSASHGL